MIRIGAAICVVLFATPARAQTHDEDVKGHAVHDNAVNYYVLFDQLEWQTGDRDGINVDNKGWIGRDKDRLWFRSELQREGGRTEDGEAHLMYGRAVARWWEVVAGIRQDVRPGPAQTWAAIGIQGLAPYWFEVEATAYVGGSGQTAVRLETEYELLLTNRLILQPLVEVNLYGKDNVEQAIGAGLSSAEAGFRVRYEVRRELAPYVGVAWNGTFGKTKDLMEATGRETGGARFVVGARLWF
jgi:copper resistance protein B